MKQAALIVLLASVGIAQAAPAPSPVMGKHDANQPINISSDHFTAEKSPAAGATAPAVLTYSGNVVITQGEIRMRANDVKINVIGGKPDKIYANGNVVVNSASGIATGDNGVYDVSPRLVTLTGHVVLTKEKNVMRGQRLTVNLVTGVANLGAGGGPATGTTGGGRVQAVFTPPPQSGGK